MVHFRSALHESDVSKKKSAVNTLFPGFVSVMGVVVQGLVLTPNAETQFDLDNGPTPFKFVVSDIMEIRPIVRVQTLFEISNNEC